MDTPKWFTAIAVVALVWNVIGVLAFAVDVTMTAEDLQALAAADRTVYENTPGWVTASFGVAVIAGTLGSLGLVLKRSLAIPLLALSLAAVLLQTGWSLMFSDAIELLGGQVLLMSGLVCSIALGLYLLARSAGNKGWLS
jgi:hypothetical protein